MAAPPERKSDREKDAELGRLCLAIHQARLQLRWFRQTRLDMVRQTLGAHYSEDAAERSVPINVLGMAHGILGRKLVPKNPRVMLSTFERRYRPAVSIMQDWANVEIENLNLANTFRRIVTDALFYIGIAKVGIATPTDATYADWSLRAGEPFIERIDLDDFVYDIHAKDFSECGYMGHRIRVPLKDVHESPYYGPNRKKVTATHDAMFNTEGDERLPMIGRGYYSDTEEYEPFVDLWEIYLRRERVIVTLLDDALTGANGMDEFYGKDNRRALRVQKWIGPARGPYHILGFGAVPGNPMAKGPLHDIYDLHLAINNIARKLIREAKATKKLTLISGNADEDAKRINEADDGTSVKVEDPKNIQQVWMNEPNQSLFLLMQEFIQRASWLMGNLDLIGGLGPQAKTATQDRLNASASSDQIGSLQDDTLSFVSEVFKSWLWLHHHHPTKVHKVNYDLGHEGLPRVNLVRRSFPNNPDVHGNDPNVTVRAHDFDDMRMLIDPYSMTHSSPTQRAQNMVDAVQKVYLPMAQLAQQQGVGLDLNAFFRKLGQYWDDPDLEEIFSFLQKPPEEGGGNGKGGAGVFGDQPEGPKEPTEIIRRSLGADSQQAKQSMLANAMAGGANGNGQPAMGNR